MTTIRGRKHPATRQPRLAQTVALTTLALGMPATVLAQSQPTAQSLPTVQVTSDRESSFKVEEAASSKFTAPLVDTPKSITVVPVEVLRQTNATTMRDALRTVPGITFGLGEGGTPEGDR